MREIVYEPPVSWRRGAVPSVLSSVPHTYIRSSRTNILQTAASDAAEIVVLSDEEDSQGFYVADASGETIYNSGHPGIYPKNLNIQISHTSTRHYALFKKCELLSVTIKLSS